MEREYNKELIKDIVDKINGQPEEEQQPEQVMAPDDEGLSFEHPEIETPASEEQSEDEPAIEVAEESNETAEEATEGENTPKESEGENTAESVIWHTYVPRFTEASERYRMKGDAKIRAILKGKGGTGVEKIEEGTDEQFEPTAEFAEDLVGAEAKTPENKAVDESDSSLSIYKFDGEDDFMDEINGRTADQEKEEIEKLLKSDPISEPAPAAEPVPEPAPIEEEPAPAAEPVPEEKEYRIPDPKSEDMGVYDFSAKSVPVEEEEDLPEGINDSPASMKKGRETEFNNPAQRDSFKDKFLDSLISIRIRLGASLIFALALFVLELLSAVKVIPYRLFDASEVTYTLGLVDFLLAACVFVMALPELVRAIRHLFGKKLLPDVLPLPAFIVLALYTLTLVLTSASSYSLFGFLFAVLTLPIMYAALYRTKADFIAFKMVSRTEEKQVIDKKNTREFGAENIALDGVIDEYKSKTARTFRASFISDFFKNSSSVALAPKDIGIILAVPFGVAVVAGVIAYFLTWSFVDAMEVLSIVCMVGCPAFAIIANKVTYFHTQRAALLTDSTAIGEDSYHNYSAVDVFAFDDTDIFGPDDVNLKRFMLYGERDSMEKVMRQMSALFAAVGGPLDYMFSNVIDNRVRHKSATNLVIEDDGILGEVAGRKVCAGSEDYMRRNGIAIPSGAIDAETVSGIDTTKVMYAAEDGEVYAKFYIRYSFSEEFTAILPSLRESGVIPLIYTRDPNVSNELLSTLTAGNGCMRVVKMYSALPGAEKVFGRVSANMITYGDKIDAASMIVLSKKYRDFSLRIRFAELCAMGIGVLLAILLSVFGFSRATVLIASIWQVVWCMLLYLLSKANFLRELKKEK